MALIKCDECGQMISDKAEFCPKCGAPIKKVHFCKDCGAQIGPYDNVCPSCGRPVNGKDDSTQLAITHESDKNDAEKRVQRFFVQKKKFFPETRIQSLRETLYSLNKEQFSTIEFLSYKDPTVMLIISILVGSWGVDRFLLGDNKNGVLKILLTLCCGIGLVWWIVDLFQITNMTQNYNYELLENTLSYV